MKYVDGIDPRDQELAAKAGAGFLPAGAFDIHVQPYHAEIMAEIAGAIPRDGRAEASGVPRGTFDRRPAR